MHRTPRYVAVLSLAALLAASGCKKPPADDAALTAAVQTRIAADSALASESIQTSVDAGVATLNGTVSSEAARALAASDAAQIAGVRTVVNNLTVGPSVAAAAAPQTVPASPAISSAPPIAASARPRPNPSRPARIERQHIEAENTPPPAPSAPAPTPAPIDRPIPVQTAPAPPPPPTFRNIEIPAGTSIPVRITQTLDSATTQQGQSFSGSVASDVMVDGLVAIPHGTPVAGRVDAVQEAAHFKGNSLLTISLTSISHHGERLPVSSDAYTKQGEGRGKNTAEKTGVGAAAGAILGGIFGGGRGAAIGAAAGGGTGAGINGVTRGQQVQIPSETIVPFRLSGSINVRVPTHIETRQRDGEIREDQPAQPDQRRPLN